jgi:hypothetical protein
MNLLNDNNSRTRIVELLVAGATYRQITDQFPGATRSMVAGAIRRAGLIGLSKNVSIKVRPTGTKRPRRSQPPLKKQPLKQLQHWTIPGVPCKPLSPAPPPQDFPNRVSWGELEDFHCHWQVVDSPRMFCGERTFIHQIYCPYHRQMASQSTKAL